MVKLCLMALKITLFSLFSITFFVFFTHLSHAQTSYPVQNGGTLKIVLNEEPLINKEIEVAVQSNTIDLTNLEIKWFVDDEPLVSTGNKTKVKMKGLGETTKVQVVAKDDLNTFTTIWNLLPVDFSILWEADTKIPNFYKGQPLPTSGSPVRLYAFVRFIDENGDLKTEDNFFIVWRNNKSGKTLQQGLGVRNITADKIKLLSSESIYSAELLFNNYTPTSYRFDESVRISTVDPIIMIYPLDQIFGIHSDQAFDESRSVNKDVSFSLIAKSFFVEDQPTNFVWSLNKGSEQRSTTGKLEFEPLQGLGGINLKITVPSENLLTQKTLFIKSQ